MTVDNESLSRMLSPIKHVLDRSFKMSRSSDNIRNSSSFQEDRLSTSLNNNANIRRNSCLSILSSFGDVFHWFISIFLR